MTATQDTGADIERAQWGLRRYVRGVAAELGLSHHSAWCELADEASAYLAIDQRLPHWPDRDVALIWDEHRGWAVGVETGAGDDLQIVAWYGPDLLPAPADVVRFTASVLASGADRFTSAPPPLPPAQQRNTLRARLVDFFSAERP